MAVKHNPLTSKSTKKEVEKVVATWLTGFWDRVGKRLQRAHKEARKREKRRNKEMQEMN